MSFDQERIRRVVVVGGGSAGFMSALTLKTMLPQLDLTVVHSSSLPPIGVGESTTSLIPLFLHQGLRIDTKQFFHEVVPTWKLGIRFDWGEKGADDYYYPFDLPLDSLRSGTLGKENAYYFFADRKVFSHYTVMMDEERSPCFPKADGGFQMSDRFGYHIENRAFISFLNQVAVSRGIQVVDQAIENVSVSSDNAISAVELSNGTSLSGDLFVDCTGFSSRLLGTTLQEPFVDYSDSLFCDTAVTGSWRRETGVLPYTTCQTMDHGWCWRIELADRVNRGYVFSSQFCSVDQAIDEMKQCNPQLGDECRTVQFRSGRYQRFWVGNVAAIGNASGFVEPLESTGLHMIAVTARTLGQALVDTDCRPPESMRSRINQFIGRVWDDIRNFLSIHFAFNRKRDTPFWKHCQENTNLSDAQTLLDFYLDCGPSSMASELIPSNSVFRHAGYLAMLIGQHVPSDYEFVMSPMEHDQWSEIRRRVRSTAMEALPVDDGLSLIRRQADAT